MYVCVYFTLSALFLKSTLTDTHTWDHLSLLIQTLWGCYRGHFQMSPLCRFNLNNILDFEGEL